jgi:hypothetical protein
MGAPIRRAEHQGMLRRISHRTLFLLALAAALLLAWTGTTTPASAACAPGAADKPDLAFVDSNCDGIDGDKAAALFVAPGGSDAKDGSFGNPKASVAAAVTAALAAGKDVYVAAGTYPGKVSFLGAAGNIGVYGGYHPQTWQRSASHVTTLESAHQVVFVSLPGIVMQLLTLHGLVDATTTTSYGVRAVNGGEVALSRVTIDGAPGAKGADGASSPPSPPTAPGGAQGKVQPGCGGPVGAGGTGPDVLSGGNGGTGWDVNLPFSGHKGSNDIGLGISGGQGGLDPGEPGFPGDSGWNGNAGTGGSAALNFASGLYMAMPGSPGTPGIRGAGGGGGAGSDTYWCLPGSGGGAGGRPGAGGAGGKGGGGSIGVFAGAGARALVLDGSVIHTANGGKGGNGAAGQPGGAGGPGGPAGVATYYGVTHHSGHGGNGGYGGQGGQGGGGAGGASIGVLAIDARAFVDPGTTITVGTGGAGGIAGFDGKPGVAQKTAQVTTAGGSLPPVGDFDGDGVDNGTDACPVAAGTGNGCPAPPPPPPTSSSVTQTSSTTQTSATGTQAFAGVRLVSTRLTFAGRFIALKLSCPAGTVGRCTGRTTLTARPRRTSARRVTLGRASFAISAGSQARVRVRVTRAGRRLLGSAPRRRGRAVNAARDGAGRSRITRAAVTIRRRHR